MAPFQLELSRSSVLRVGVGACTDVGRKRADNEDCYCVLREMGLFVVSDGIGGQAKGEVASAMAVDTVVTQCQHAGIGSIGATNPAPQAQSQLSARTRHLANAVRLANRKIRSAAAGNPGCQGMGATLVAAWFSGEQLSVVSIGDSRAYMYRNGTLKQLTRDHSLAAERVRRGFISKEQAATSAVQNILLQALGTSDKIEVEAQDIPLQHGDLVLLCTDGLTHMVTDAEIAGALVLCEDAQRVADRLVEMACAHGGTDNITVVVLRFQANGNSLFDRLRRSWGSAS